MRTKYIVMGILAVLLGAASLGMINENAHGEEGSQTDASYSDASYLDATYLDATYTDATVTDDYKAMAHWEDREDSYSDDMIKKGTDKKPDTGDRADILMYTVLLAASLSFIIHLYRKYGN